MRKLVILGLFLWIGLAGAAGAQEEGSLRFEKTVNWTTGKLIDIGATVGLVRIGKVRIKLEAKFD